MQQQSAVIIGSGLIARAFSAENSGRPEVAETCLFACGVSDSSCVDPGIFGRERALLERALRDHSGADAFVYFSTCSLNVHGVRRTPYTQHKAAMERLVGTHRRALVLRLPQVAGAGGNPKTLLNHLHARIASGAAFEVWAKARRSIIDVRDVVDLTTAFLRKRHLRGVVADLAPPRRHRIEEIVDALETAIGREARFSVVDKGHDEPSEPGLMMSLADDAGERFDERYLMRTILRHHSEPGVNR